MDNDQLQKMRPDVWSTKWQVLAVTLELTRKLDGYKLHLDQSVTVMTSCYTEAERVVDLLVKVTQEIEAASTEQDVYQLIGRAKKHLKRVDMSNPKCVFRIIDSYLHSKGKPVTPYGNGFLDKLMPCE